MTPEDVQQMLANQQMLIAQGVQLLDVLRFIFVVGCCSLFFNILGGLKR